jgi:branched-chain amino acid transport system permease protein
MIAKQNFFTRNRGILIFFVVMLLLPFLIGMIEGSTPAMVLSNSGSFSKFLEGLGIEIFIFALFALSYDLLFGVTGLLSFGHSMFFAVPAYLTGSALKTMHLPFWQVILLVLLVAVVQALLFSLVLPRVKGVTFTLVSLGLASVFHIIVMSSDMINLTGADVGLQGVPTPTFIDPASQRFRFYLIALVLLVATYIFYRRFVSSPTGRVAVAIRENEGRTKMLGYNTTTFKIVVMIISSITAAIAGMLHALYQPIISPSVADLGYTVTGLLIVLIGGVGTLSGAVVGAFVLRLLDFSLRRFIGESASFITGAIYVIFVLFVPYGIVGTLRLKKLGTKAGWKDLIARLTGKV